MSRLYRSSYYLGEASRLLARAEGKRCAEREGLIWEIDDALKLIAAAADELGYTFTKKPEPAAPAPDVEAPAAPVEEAA